MGKRIITIDLATLDEYRVKTYVETGAMVRVQYPCKSYLIIEQRVDRYHAVGRVSQIRVVYMAYSDMDGDPHWQACQTQYFAPNDVTEAVRCFMDRAKSDKPHRANRGGISLQELSTQQKA